MASIASSLERIKDDPLGVLGRERVEHVCREHDVSWRQRQLDPATTVGLFIRQVLHGNAPCSEVRHIAASGSGSGSGGPAAGGTAGSFTPQAYCAARARLPLAVYQALVNEVYQTTMAAGAADVARGAPVARPPHLPRRRLDVLHARHAGAAQGLRDAVRPEGRVRIPGGPPAGAVQRRHGPARRRLGLAAADGGPGRDARGAPAPGRGGRPHRRRLVQRLPAPGGPRAAGAARPVPGAPPADRELREEPAAQRRGAEGPGEGAADVSVGQVAGEGGPTRRVLQARPQARADEPGG